MNTLLVTGGAGFIGSNFVRLALARGAPQVITLDKLTYAGNPENLQGLDADGRHQLVQGDICDRALVTSLLFRYRPGALVNFAAESHVDRSIDGPATFIQTNVVGTFELLEATRAYLGHLRAEGHADKAEAFRFLHVSTDEVFGSLGSEGAFHELTRYAPNSPYAASKAGADHLVRAYHETYRLPTLTTNCSNNYGPYQFPEKLIPLMILNALDGKPLPLYGDGLNVRDWLYVEDHCDAILRVLEAGRPGETYVIGGNNEQTNLAVVRKLCDLLDELAPASRHPGLSSYRELITFVTDRPGHDRRYAIDATKIRRELGWTPTHSFPVGLRATVRWYLDNRSWCDRITSGVYRRERLGLGSEVNS
ncbi:MAG: dTDP-glucose 4,6-dehydratase [Myxococcales bacterium]|nr:dTDP-glucose 4,6-dehydratase [Polyangiaceae bacterium]MDW8247850.1 dTDP-glucose 4,6-dehydratase [Myxococcales bacterium]